MSKTESVTVRLAVALDGAGWHPAAWRLPTARPTELLSAGYWVDLARKADRAGFDLVTFEDALALQSAGGDPVSEVRGRLDAVLIAARVAPLTERIGLVPTTTVTHTEPFHLSKAIATLDYVSGGRAGWLPRIAGAAEAAHVGRRTTPPEAEAYEEAADVVEVVRQLWDSWEDDAEIRDAATGRFVDRDKLHHIDFAGRWFSVRGPSITPRPPQGQPIVAAVVGGAESRAFAARSADVAFIAPADQAAAAATIESLAAERDRSGRPGRTQVYADLDVLLDVDEGRAYARWAQLADWSARPAGGEVFVGTPAKLADELIARAGSGIDGFRLRPAALPQDLDVVADELVPELRARGVLAADERVGTLRERLGLERPVSRYASVVAP